MTLPIAPSLTTLLAELKRRLGDFAVEGWEGRSGDELYQAMSRTFSHLAQRVRFLLLSGYTRRARGSHRHRLTLRLTWAEATTNGYTLSRDQVLFETAWGARYRLLADLTRSDAAAAGTQDIEVEAEWAGFDYVVAPGTVTRFVIPSTISPAASLVFSEGTTSLGKAEFIASVAEPSRSSDPPPTLTVTNLASGDIGALGLPDDGATGFLDLLAMERGMPRVPDESDDTLRTRIRALPDILTPAAILRGVRAVYGAWLVEQGITGDPEDVALYEHWNYGYAPGVAGIGVHPPARAWSFMVTVPELPYTGTGYAPDEGAVGVHGIGSTGELDRNGILAAFQAQIDRIRAPGIWGALYEQAP